MSLVQPLLSPPSSSLSLTVPPILRKPLTPLSRSMLEQPSHDRPSEPKPKPNPIQNPWRVCGCWARAAAAPSRASSRAAAEIRVSMRMTNLLVGAPTAPSTKDRKSTRSELQSPYDLVCRLLLEKKKTPEITLKFHILLTRSISRFIFCTASQTSILFLIYPPL